jgi:type I restriction enzyme S subunit
MMSAPTLVPLRELLVERSDPHAVEPETQYPIAGVYGFGRGMIRRPPVSGQEIAAENLFRIKKDQFIYSRLKSFEGAFALVTSEADGYFVSNEFPTFDVDRTKLEPAYLGWYFRQPKVWKQLAAGGKGIGARRERLPSRRLLDHLVPLPSLIEQQRALVLLDATSERLASSRQFAEATRADLAAMLTSAYSKITAGAPRKRMDEAAPLVRRPIVVEPDGVYPELGIRSFGKGTFHKPALQGIEVGNKRLFEVRRDDLLLNIVFAWEGAVAVATASDHGRVGSHRFLTCVPDPALTSSMFLQFHFMTAEGIHQLGAASPGGAGRNRTLGLKALEKILVPVPSLDSQAWFSSLHRKNLEVERRQQEVASELDRLLPALLHNVFG